MNNSNFSWKLNTNLTEPVFQLHDLSTLSDAQGREVMGEINHIMSVLSDQQTEIYMFTNVNNTKWTLYNTSSDMTSNTNLTARFEQLKFRKNLTMWLLARQSSNLWKNIRGEGYKCQQQFTISRVTHSPDTLKFPDISLTMCGAHAHVKWYS